MLNSSKYDVYMALLEDCEKVHKYIFHMHRCPLWPLPIAIRLCGAKIEKWKNIWTHCSKQSAPFQKLPTPICPFTDVKCSQRWQPSKMKKPLTILTHCVIPHALNLPAIFRWQFCCKNLSIASLFTSSESHQGNSDKYFGQLQGSQFRPNGQIKS